MHGSKLNVFAEKFARLSTLEKKAAAKEILRQLIEKEKKGRWLQHYHAKPK